MKFIVSKSILAEALGITGKAISPNNVVPIVGSYLLQIKNNSLTITGSNLQLYISKQIAIECKDFEAEIATPAARFYGLIKELPEQPLIFFIEETRITLQSDCGNYNFHAEPGKDFPQLKNSKEVSLSMGSQDLLAGINRTLFACSTDELRPALTGVLISFQQAQVTYTATNAAILSTHSYEADVDAKFSFIVPAKILAIVQALSSGKLIHIHLDKKSIVLHIDEHTVLKSRLIDDKYPDYQAVIPKENPYRFTSDRAELISSLKRVTLFSEGNNHRVVLEVDESKCLLKTDNLLGETAQESIRHQYTGEPLSIGIDGKNMLACLSKLETETISLALSGPNRAMLLREVGPDESNETNLMLLMPLL